MRFPRHSVTKDNRFLYLLAALTVLLLGYPYWGPFVGGLISLVIIIPSVYAVRSNPRIFRGAMLLAAVTTLVSVVAMVQGVRGHLLVEGSFFFFYLFVLTSIFSEFMRTSGVTEDSLYGAVCVYVLLGIAFGQLFDVVETLQPGSFSASGACGDDSLGWRHLIFFSFMTLTTVGYGDITPATDTTRSLALIEGTIGVLYVAIMIARFATPGVAGETRLAEHPGDTPG